MKEIPYDRSEPRPQVLIVGEYLLNSIPVQTMTLRNIWRRTDLRSLRRG